MDLGEICILFGCSDANAGPCSPSQEMGAVSQNAENSTAEPVEEIVITNVFEAMHDKVEADGLVEDDEKGKDKAKQPKPEGGRKKSKDNVTPGIPGTPILNTVFLSQ
jgi:hypothetical protein